MPDHLQSGGTARGLAGTTPQYSFVVPIFTDEELADDFCVAFDAAMRSYTGREAIEEVAELIFVQDGGTEEGSSALRGVCDKHAFAKLVTLTRNFGQHIAVSCGYRHAAGEYVGMLNVDQEDPPDQIPLLLDALKSGDADIAYCVRRSRQSPRLVAGSSLAFNWVLNKATGYDIPRDVGTLRIMRRRAVEHLNALSESGRYLPGLEMWLGMRGVYVATDHQRSVRGRSSYTMRRRFRLAFEAIVGFSDLPLRVVSMVGAMIALLGFGLVGFLVIGKLFSADYSPGYTSTIAAIVFMGGVQIYAIGLASLYIGRVLAESQRRPLYVVRDRYKIDQILPEDELRGELANAGFHSD